MNPTSCRACCIVMLANPVLGVVSPSWRAKEAFEEAGYAVFWFTPDRWPLLFSDGIADLSRLDALTRRWAVDAVVLADGIAADASSCVVQVSHMVVLVATACDLQASTERTVGAEIDACWVLEGVSYADVRLGEASVHALGAAPDLVSYDLVNEIALPEGIGCTQDATPQRIEYVRAALASIGGDVPIRCLGDGWPAEWQVDTSADGAAYALGSMRMLLRFSALEGEGPLGGYLMHAARQLGGALTLRVEMDSPISTVADRAAAMWESRTTSACSTMTGEGSHSVRGAFERSVADAMNRLVSNGVAPSAVARVAAVLGYVGRGNFGDEYILSTIAERLAARCPGAVTVAVSEDPWHTLVNRGIYSIALSSKYALDGLLERSSVAIVMAGLLFDQGIRWTMGKAELASSVLHSDIPGIAAFVELAQLNDTPAVLYGIGAGPLERIHSKRLVRFMGTLGARFICRDQETARLISACDVPAPQVSYRADVAFTGTSHATESVDAWFANQELDPARHELIVVSLREYENVGNDFCTRIAAAFDRVLAAHPSAHIAFAMLDPDDRGISERVVDAMERIDRVHLFSTGDDIMAMADFIGRATVGISMRYHASLLMFRSSVPCIGLGYLPNICSLYEEMGMGPSLLSMEVSAEGIAAALLHALDNRAELVKALEDGTRNLTSLACQAEDELVGIVESTGPVCAQDNGRYELYLYRESASDRTLDDARVRARGTQAHFETLEAELAAARRRVNELEQSNSYRIGSVLTFLPGLLKHRGR